MKNPTSPRLLYSRYGPEDREDYIAMSTNAEVMLHITGEPMSHDAASQRYEKLLALNAEHPDCGAFIVRLKENGAYMGFGKAVYMEWDKVEIGYAMMPEHWGKGYGLEIGQAMKDFGLEMENVPELLALIDPQNEASRKILLKLGFVLRDSIPMDGAPCETYHFQILKP